MFNLNWMSSSVRSGLGRQRLGSGSLSRKWMWVILMTVEVMETRVCVCVCVCVHVRWCVDSQPWMVECSCLPGFEPYHKPWLAASAVSHRGHEEFGLPWTLSMLSEAWRHPSSSPRGSAAEQICVKLHEPDKSPLQCEIMRDIRCWPPLAEADQWATRSH